VGRKRKHQESTWIKRKQQCILGDSTVNPRRKKIVIATKIHTRMRLSMISVCIMPGYPWIEEQYKRSKKKV
jgi:hypothetical protein